jgi:hypothetical protein
MFADPSEKAVARIRRNISGDKTMITIFIPSRRFLIPAALPKGTKFNQNYFIAAIFPGLYNEKRRISRKDGFPASSVHMDNSMCHHGNKISEKLAKQSLERAPHPSYSPDISPCDFWLFGKRKHKMKDREFQSQHPILNAIPKMWNASLSQTYTVASRNGCGA